MQVALTTTHDLPADRHPAAVYLASSDSAWVTGETLYISGGLR